MDIRRKAAGRILGCEDARHAPLSILTKTRDADASLLYEKAVPADIRLETPGSETSTRSSTPATDSSSHYYTPSTSSLSTSALFERECSCPREDHHGSCAKEWADECHPPRGESPVLRSDDMPPRIPARPPVPAALRSSQLRNAVSAGSSESSLGSDTPESDGDEDQEEDDDWSGDNDTLDATVMAAVDGDYPLAAFLIPLLYRNLHRDPQSAARTKVESWQYTAASGTESSAGGDHFASSSSPDPPARNSRKRRRQSVSGGDRDPGDDEDEDGDGDDGQNPDNSNGRPEAPDGQPVLYLACPFHKLNPSKYATQYGHLSPGRKKDYYRSCAGPGFKSIQRLKEHLKRKHRPVQCNRCYTLFTGPDVASCMNQLREHQRAAESCEIGDGSLMEGISEAQWAQLEKQNRKKNQEKHKVDKWFDIWRVIFPSREPPDTPWYDSVNADHHRPQSPSDSDFAQIFQNILLHKIRHGDISFPDNQPDMTERLTHLAMSAFNLYRNLHGSRTDTSSSHTGGSNQRDSLLGGSSTHPSVPTTMTSLSLPHTAASISTATTATQQLQGQQLPQQHSPPYTFGPVGSAAGVGPPAVPFGLAMGQFHPQGANIMPANFPALPPQDASGVNVNAYYVPLMYSGQQWPTAALSFPRVPAPFPAQTPFPTDIFGPPGSERDFHNLQQ